jgi:hypothetical protein
MSKTTQSICPTPAPSARPVANGWTSIARYGAWAAGILGPGPAAVPGVAVVDGPHARSKDTGDSTQRARRFRAKKVEVGSAQQGWHRPEAEGAVANRRCAPPAQRRSFSKARDVIPEDRGSHAHRGRVRVSPSHRAAATGARRGFAPAPLPCQAACDRSFPGMALTAGKWPMCPRSCADARPWSGRRGK